MTNLENFTPKLTADGSFTFVSQEFGESFHSHYGARQESFFKFVEPTQLATAAQKPVLRILDICYGLGYNTAAALETIWAVNPSCCVEVICLEVNPAVPQAAIAHRLFDNWNCNYTEILSQLAFEYQVQTPRLKAKLLIGDARTTIASVHQSGFLADAIFLDPFSPPQCPQLWTVEFIKQLSLCLHQDGLLATYSCAAAVRTALLSAGLVVGSTPPVGRRSPGTIAIHSLSTELQSYPVLSSLSQAEKEHLLTRAAIPYRDPKLSDSTEVIVMRRQQEQQISSLEPTSRWRKRWLLGTQGRDFMGGSL
ncbi:MAG: tRNA (5-methylaminomethyl-2-thiouridine)(34)-methyltransferase MnmD [Nostoc sp. DedVER02]|uniref:tRNA (5-methylaminomethyl-2-thiouridine)(34)-methyltransferase MnmD n=1 Tax=unclassified Nostoc TaxID=2593658 RepID=UPI002AD2E418|nr:MULTISPECIES: MnmC family methyltransferase [unclassified Nostoc]MDZ7985622.1 MnmC family methyltransferase [Nostoc sp. DedVER02]MDZ8113016.1 MnmC family methyltransferase [Nostoc sp. DedVER01b]